MSVGVPKPPVWRPHNVSLGGSGVSIGGVRSLRVETFNKNDDKFSQDPWNFLGYTPVIKTGIGKCSSEIEQTYHETAQIFPCHFCSHHMKPFAKNSKMSPILKQTGDSLVPIGSMYGIYTYIYHKNQPNVGKYTIHGSYGVGFLRVPGW